MALQQFQSLREHWEEERSALFNYFHDHTWDNDYSKIFIYTATDHNSKHPERERKNLNGAHFFITRFCDFSDKGLHIKYESKRAVYCTRHREYYKDEECFVVRKTVLESLKDAYIFFEGPDYYTEMIPAADLLKVKPVYRTVNQNKEPKLYFKCSDFPTFKKDFHSHYEGFDCFHPIYVGNYTFVSRVHGVTVNFKAFRGDNLLYIGNSETVKDFYDTYGLAAHGAKYETIRSMICKKQNFTLDGITYVFNDDWETVTYKVRNSKKVKEQIQEIISTSDEEIKESLTKIVQPEEEEIICPFSFKSEDFEPSDAVPYAPVESINVWDLRAEKEESVFKYKDLD